MARIKEIVIKLKESWASDKVNFILSTASWIFFACLMCTLQLFTSMKGMSYLPIIFSGLLFISTLIHIFKKGTIALTSPIICLVAFILYAFVVTVLTSKVFEPYFKTMVNISIMSVTIFLFGINFKNQKNILIIYILSAIILAITFIVVCREDIFSFNSASADRVGEQFGNVNGVGLTFCFAIICNSIFIVFYKKMRIALAILDFAFLFLILKTGSRSSFVIAIITLLLCLILSLYKQHKIILIVCIGLLISLIIVLLSIPQFAFFRNRFLSLLGFINSDIQTEASARIRFDMQINGLELWFKKMFFGHGSEGFKQITSYPYFSHASLSEMLCNYGLIGFVLFYLPFVYSYFKSKKGSLSKLIYLFLDISILLPTLFFGIIFYEKPFFVFIGIVSAISFNEACGTQKYRFVISFTNWFKNIKIDFKLPNIKSVFKPFVLKRSAMKQLILLPCLLFVFSGAISCFSLTKKASYESVSSIVTQISAKDSITKSMNLNLQSFEEEVMFNDLKNKIDICRTLTYSKTSGELYNYRLGYFSEFDTYFTFDNIGIERFSMLPHTTSGIHENEKKEYVFDWYEIKMQYKTMPIIHYDSIDTFIEIRESTAKLISENLGITYSKDSFAEMINKGLFIEGNFLNREESSPIKYQIANVIIENEGQDGFYYKTFGNYFCSYLRNGSIPILNNYSINYDFGSSFIENYNAFQFLENNFSRETFDYQISTINLKDKNKSDTSNRLKQFSDEYSRIHNNYFINDVALFVILVSLLAVIFCVLCFLNLKRKIGIFVFDKRSILIIGLSYSIVYAVFYLLNVIMGMPFIPFFTISGIAASFVLCILLLSIFYIFYKQQKDINLQFICDDFYEIKC